MNVSRRIVPFLVLLLAFPCFAEPPVLDEPDPGKPDLSKLESLSPQEAASLQEKVTYLDVRSTLEWLAGHVKGAVHIPYDEAAQRIASEIPDRSVPLIAYCASGGRALYVVDALRKQGYTVVPVTNGGYRELIAHGMEKD